MCSFDINFFWAQLLGMAILGDCSLFVCSWCLTCHQGHADKINEKLIELEAERKNWEELIQVLD